MDNLNELSCTTCRYKELQKEEAPCKQCICNGWDVKELHEWERGIRKLKAIKNKVLRGLACINGFLFVFGCCTLDSTGIYYNISLTLTIVCGLWLLLFYLANYERVERKYGIWE